jgi:hypothetical protein
MINYTYLKVGELQLTSKGLKDLANALEVLYGLNNNIITLKVITNNKTDELFLSLEDNGESGIINLK